MNRNQSLSALLAERRDLEHRALDWADRWKASMGGDPESAIAIIRPISFSREEVARHIAEHCT